MKIIGISGIKQSGKSEVAAKIIELHRDEYHIVKLHFALPLKKILAYFVQEVTDCTNEQAMDYFNDPLLKEKEIVEIGTTPRVLMTTFGTDFIRSLKDTIWTNATNNAIKKLEALEKDLNKKVMVIIDDIRFENELEFVRQLDGHIIFVARNNNIINPTLLQQIKTKYKIWRKQIHISEKGLYNLRRDKDILIINDGSIFSLWSKVKLVCKF